MAHAHTNGLLTEGNFGGYVDLHVPQYSKEQSQLRHIRRLCSRHRLGESHKTWSDLLFLFSSHLSTACMTVSYAVRSTYTRPHPEL